MKVHRVHFFVNSDERVSLGYEYFPSKKAALARIEEATKAHWITTPDGAGKLRFETDVIQADASEGGLIKALNDYGSHPDTR